ncbi:MAG TPA: cupin [Verrucomicrobia bacterium]|nr:MAG: hypothetical protein A2X46_09075 [Lentisphaerae bacterium GWF2_57_35]HBA86278.1 cupin [Verrucomicrobiota bacterium]
MKTVRLDQIEKSLVTIDGASKAWRQLALGRADGAPTVSFRVFTLEPGGHTPYHTHAAEHMNYIIEGAGCLVDEKGTEHPVQAGDFAFVAPNEKHQYRNKGPALFKMICAVPKEYE